jgi:hypothetical protein
MARSHGGVLAARQRVAGVSDEAWATRPPARPADALARLTASEYGHPAPGVEEAKKLLNV